MWWLALGILVGFCLVVSGLAWLVLRKAEQAGYRRLLDTHEHDFPEF